jgi:integrase
MGYKFKQYGNRKLWRSNFTVERPDGTNTGEYVQVDVTNEPDLWQKRNGSIPRRAKAMLDAKQVQKEAKVKVDSPVTDDKRTVAQTCIDFLNERATPIPIKGGLMVSPLKPNTISEFDHYFRTYIIKELGHVRMVKLSSSQIYRFYQGVQANGATPSTLLNLRRRFQRLLNWAVERHYIDANPTGQDALALVKESEKLEKENKPREKNLTREAMLGIFHLIGTKYKKFEITTHLLGLQGLREGEALAVCFNNIDLDANTLTVNSQIQNVTLPQLIEVEYEAGLKDVTPKTVEGNRVIHLDRATKALIESIPVEDRQGYVLTTKTGTPYNPNNFRRDFFNKLRADLVEEGLWDSSEKLTPHKLRKFYATAQMKMGVDGVELKGNMGHKDIKTTHEHYILDIEDSEKTTVNVSDWVKEMETK